MKTGLTVKPDLPLVSIILLTYNHRHTIEATLRSIFRQDYTQAELIVLDDNSDDDTFEIVDRMIRASTKAYVNIVIEKNKKNLGMAGNCNKAASYASGEYLAILHHDDIYAENLISTWLELMQENSCAFCYNRYAAYNDILHYGNLPADKFIDGELFVKKYMMNNFSSPVRGTAMIRSSVWHELGGMRLKFGLIADVDLWIRAALRSGVCYTPKTLIKTVHARPEKYPNEYSSFTWLRWRKIYHIYISASEEVIRYNFSLGFFLYMRTYLLILGNNIKWLGYALYKKKYFIVRDFFIKK